jgi:hypothetical protein
LEFNDIAAWAYSQTGQVSDLCSILLDAQDSYIVTKNAPQVLNGVNELCPTKMKNIKLIQ